MNTLESKQLAILKSLARKIFKFFASVQLAIIILVVLMGVLAAGTIIESLHGADAAKIVIYEATWFSFVLLILGINLLAAALDRLPWKIKHTGFVITHLGIILILIGSYMSQRFTLDGQMVLSEGETSHEVTLHKPILYLVSEKNHRDWAIGIKKKAFMWNGREALHSLGASSKLPADIHLLSYYPKARMEEKLIASESGPAAIDLTIQSDFMNENLQLIANHPNLGAVNLGPMSIVFSQEKITSAAENQPKKNYLEFQFGDKKVHVHLDKDLKLPAELPIEGTGYIAEITAVYKNAAVEGKQLIEKPAPSGEAQNPAIRLVLKGNGIAEPHTVFSKFPDFPTIHGMGQAKSKVRIFYMVSDDKRAQGNEIRFIPSPEGLQYQIIKGSNIQTGDVVVGQDMSTGWMNLKFRINHYYKNSSFERSFRPVPNATEGDDVFSAIQLELTKGSEAKKIWVGQGMKSPVVLGDSEYAAIFSSITVPVGFRLTLKDFRVENYSGTNRPASYESDVVLKDPGHGAVKEQTISMNNPLIYRGVRIYQSGYSIQEGRPEISIFSVGKDPGVPLNYLGTIVMAIGIVAMFYTRKFSSNGGRIA